MRFLIPLFFIILLLPFSLFSQTANELFLKATVAKLEHAKEYTVRAATAMPAEKYGYKPVEDQMNFGEQLLHLSANLGWLSSSYLSSGKNPVTRAELAKTSKGEIIEVVVKSYDYAIHALKQFDVKNLGDTVKFFAGPLNKLQIINLLNDHQTHHRAEVLVYLRLNRIKPPDYIGW